MGVEEEGFRGWPPAPSTAPPYIQKDDRWTQFDNMVNAVSFGFVATAILISMFLVMAIFEKFLRTTSQTLTPSGGPSRLTDIESQNSIFSGFNSKLGHPSPKLKITTFIWGYVVSFGFVATAILISMFLVMAIFEKFLRTTSQTLTPSGGPSRLTDIESQNSIFSGFNSKLGHPSPKISVNAREVSVLMPGDNGPTFIAQPAPVPCLAEGMPSPSD